MLKEYLLRFLDWLSDVLGRWQRSSLGLDATSKDNSKKSNELPGYPPGFESLHPTTLFYRGPGIPAAKHVQEGTFDFACPKCGSIEHVVVLSSEWSVSIHSGDARGLFVPGARAVTSAFQVGLKTDIDPAEYAHWVRTAGRDEIET